MIEEIDTVKIPAWALPILVNGDSSGCTGSEENALEVFLLDYEDYEGLVFEAQEESFFSWTNDVDGLGGEVFTVTILGHKSEKVNA